MIQPRKISDPKLIRRELYNPNNFDIVVDLDVRHSMYVLGAGIYLGPKRALLKAKDRLLVPHMYLVFTAQNGAPSFDLVEIFGDRIGKGETKPSPFY